VVIRYNPRKLQDIRIRNVPGYLVCLPRGCELRSWAARAVKLSYINKQMKKNITRLHTHFLGLAGITGLGLAGITGLGLAGITGITASIFSLGLMAKTQGFCTSSSFRIEKKAESLKFNKADSVEILPVPFGPRPS